MGAMIGLGWLWGKKSKSDKEIEALQKQSAQQQMELSGEAAGFGRKYLPQGVGYQTEAANFWQKLLSGDRTAMMEYLAPEISGIRNQWSTLLRSASEFSPRGGLSTTFRAEAPFEQAKQIGNLMFGVRPEAAQNLAAIGGDIAQTGAGMFGTALSGYRGGAGTAAELAYQNFVRRQANLALIRDAAKGAYELGTSLFGGG